MRSTTDGFHFDKKERKEAEKRRGAACDTRIYRRLCALLWLDDGRSQCEVAELLGVTDRTIRDWIKLYRKGGFDLLCQVDYRGRECDLSPEQLEQLFEEIKAGRFRSTKQARRWIEENFGRRYSLSGVGELLKRLGATFHKTSAFMFKADPEKQQAFLTKYRRQKPNQGAGVRRYFVDAVHPVWGLQVLNYRWLLRGKRFYVGVGGGRKRLNILGAWCPEDCEYLDYRSSEENVNGQTVIKLMVSMLKRHPETKKFILYLDNARYFHAVLVREWIEQLEQETGVKIVLDFLPAYSPNLNLIERLWKFLKKTALSEWHNTFAEMQAAVSSVLDHLSKYRKELMTLMTENFQLWPDDVWQLQSIE